MKHWIAALLLAASGAAFAQATPVGLWKTIDDETHAAKSYVRITESAGALTGKIEKLLDPSHNADVCDQCSGARKDKPILGLTIIEGMKKHADEPYWDGGHILDPTNGKVYRLRLTPEDGGRALQVRGYIGPFFRNQTWLRVE
ncbi:MAG: DUF2147 domain-containing protein [Burkholderiales bacterium]|nr:DUF2147 domain-containing protein [Burkholderiales bacterium]